MKTLVIKLNISFQLAPNFAIDMATAFQGLLADLNVILENQTSDTLSIKKKTQIEGQQAV